ncbi:MAG: tetratricopeptide repeat protein, partial [Smithella sp.]
ASSYAGLGYAYLASGNPDKAIENYLKALKYDREDDEIYANLGDAYEKKGLYSEALKAYKSAYEINPETRVGGKIPRLRIQLMQKKN